MSFPIVQGTRTTSSRSLSTPEPVEEYAASDQTNLVPGVPHGPFALFASSPELNAVITVSYYEMVRENSEDVECWTLELRVQIIPSCEGFSKGYRDSLFRIELPESASNTKRSKDSQGASSWAAFSNDQRSLVCLIPHAHDELQSSVVMFQLRKPKQTKNVPPAPPLPSYMAATESLLPAYVAPVATNPRFLKAVDSSPLLDATAICFCDGYLLIGCRSGRILLASIRPLQIIGQEDPFRDISIATLSAWKDEQLAVVYADNIVSCFRFRDLRRRKLNRNGSIESINTICSDTMDDSDVARRSFSIRSVNKRSQGKPTFLRRTHYSLEEEACQICWVQESYLALLNPSANKVFVRSLQEKGESMGAREMILDPRDLKECAHVAESSLVDESCWSKPSWFYPTRSSLSLDPWTQSCLAINATIGFQAEFMSCNILWNWRANTQGYTAIGNGRNLPLLQFAWHLEHGRKITRLVLRQNDVVVKEMMDVALLSPPNSVYVPRLRPSTALILSSRAVAYPIPRKSSAIENFELHWSQAMIPKIYVQSFGAPRIAVFANTFGRSIAVASSRGVCVLECSGPSIRSSSSVARMLHAGRSNPRWHLFSNTADERSFRITSFIWWEQARIDQERAEDLLIAVVEVFEEERFYLCCWPSRDLGKHSQLLRPAPDMPDGVSCWGIPLPDSFLPGTIDIVVCPECGAERSKACLMFGVPDLTCSFLVYQLQLVAGHEKSASKVLCREASAGSIGERTELFMASACFDYDLQRKHVDNEYITSVATVGAIRPSGIDALLLSTSTVSGIGQVLMAQRNDQSEVTSFWLSDVLKHSSQRKDESSHSFVWTFELANGKMLSWYLPPTSSTIVPHPKNMANFLSCQDAMQTNFRPVHPNGTILGVSSWSGSASLWMQQSSRGARRDFLVGPIPSSEFGFVIGISQSSRRISTATEFSPKKPDHDCVTLFENSGLTIYPPSRLAPIYGFAVADSNTSDTNSTCILDRVFEGREINGSLQKSSLLCLQVLILRAVEKSPTNGRIESSSSPSLRPLLVQLRSMTTPLQFISILLQLGRQLEPSNLERLFPLDLERQKSMITIEEMLVGSTSRGSLRVALSAIPILDNTTTTRRACVSIFRHCLDFINRDEHNQNGLMHLKSISRSNEEYSVMAEVFRYTMKIDRSCLQGDEEKNEGQRRYSLGCGVPGLRPSRKKRDSTVIFSPLNANPSNAQSKNFQGLQIWDHYADERFTTVLATLSRFMLSLVFASNISILSWRKLGSISRLLGGTDVSHKRCSVAEFGVLLEETSSVRFFALVPDLNNFLRFHTSGSFDIEREEAKAIFDLCLVILGSDHDDIELDIAGLILIALVVGYAAGSLDRAIDFGRQYKSSLWASFLLVTNES